MARKNSELYEDQEEGTSKKRARFSPSMDGNGLDQIAVFRLQDGTEFQGFSFGAEVSTSGEVCFNTGMVGYPEALTDPSYSGQILVLTFPLVGNYGVPASGKDEYGLEKYFESDKIHIKALIVADYSDQPSHHKSVKSLGEWLKENGIPALYGVDTRALTKKIRMTGACLGKVVFNDEDVEFFDPNLTNLVAAVSRPEPRTYGKGKFRVLALDCGMKENIIRCLVTRNVEVKVVPYNTVLADEYYDGLLISNGPGDPMMAAETVKQVEAAFTQDKPIMGICLGNQIMALAAGARTYKMKFGNRGMNQPCIDLRTTLCYITSQNHGYAVDTSSLSQDWMPLFVNANDGSNEGIIHASKPFFAVQFHPEARGGPTDTEFLFDKFVDLVKQGGRTRLRLCSLQPRVPVIRKVLLLGSGGLSIGQAGEFDYSGSQAIKALKEEGLEVILVNPNIATVQTSAGMANQVYFYPVTPFFVEEVIRKERPDGILLQFGGQTALNCGIALEEAGVLEKYGVHVLGTPISTIVATEDRKVFADKLAEINEKVAPSMTAVTVEQALEAAEIIGYPVLVRAAFALGGLGSGFASDPESMRVLAEKALSNSTQLIIDKSLQGWKEIEYEVVRDAKDNCITVCNMENFDPLGVHTGDSIVVAPSQTLSNSEYFKLRSTAIKVIRHLGVVGECNIQYALDPNSEDYCIIEVNARLSRSSALASKATGYPLAYVAAKLALGKALTDVPNAVTKITRACFEPALDYCVVKVPRWDLQKFSRVSSAIGSAMKSVGEVMSIGRTFEEAFQKAMRMVDGGAMDGFGDIDGVMFSPLPQTEGKLTAGADLTPEHLEYELANPSDRRSYAIPIAFRRGYTVDRIYELTKIDRWFLYKLKHIIEIEAALQAKPPAELSSISERELRSAKVYGFSDRQIGRCMKVNEHQVRARRLALGIHPWVKQIDTLAAEYPAQTNYLYMTYSGIEHDIKFDDKGVMVLGCGAYRIGSSCEFDWCAVSCIRTLRQLNYKNVMVNYNPETVSTDFDECDRLYFEELTLERVLDIYQVEQSHGVIVSVGGQIPNNLAVPLGKAKVNILGTTPEFIDNAEDRSKFSALLDHLNVDQPAWRELRSLESAKEFARSVKYPVLVRPSYVLSGAAMNVAMHEKELVDFLTVASDLNSDHPVVISKFIQNAKEIEYDAVANKGIIVNYAISEHVENAGTHSGDASLMLPAHNLYVETLKRIKRTSAQIAKALNITGPFNIQYLSKKNQIKVIECNLRASRSLPFVSKTYNVNFIELATKIMMGLDIKPRRIDLMDLDHVCIKVPMFSFGRLAGADPVTRVEMASTGEVACFGKDPHEAFLLASFSANFKLPKSSVLITIGPLEAKVEFVHSTKLLQKMGFRLFGTTGTCQFMQSKGLTLELMHKASETKKPNVLDAVINKEVDLVINIPNPGELADVAELSDGYKIRRAAVDYGVSLISNIKNAILMVESMHKMKMKAHWKHPPDLPILSWEEHLKRSLYL